MADERRVHPDCINASNPYHECVEYCFINIAEAKARRGKENPESMQTKGGNDLSSSQTPHQVAENHDERPEHGRYSDDGNDDNGGNSEPIQEYVDITQLKGRQKKLVEIRQKMARKTNQTAMVAEKKKMEAPAESRGISKQKSFEERKKKIGNLLDANNLDLSKAYILDTQEAAAEAKYKKCEKDPALFGWDVFNQKTLYNAYKKQTKNIEVDLDEYNKMKEADPDFYREASSLQYGKKQKKHKLLKEAAKADKRGICYLSRIPPHMDHVKLRQMFSKYGEIQRIYLAPEDPTAQINHKKPGRIQKQGFSEGWIEFANKNIAKRVANLLNGEQIGGRKRSQFYFDLWNIKYLSKFKWDELTDEIAQKVATHKQKLALEFSAAKRERDFYLARVEKARAMSSIEERLKKRQKVEQVSGAEPSASNLVSKVIRQFTQTKPLVQKTEQNPKLSKDVLAGVFGS